MNAVSCSKLSNTSPAKSLTQKSVSSRAVVVLIAALENAGGDVNSALKSAGLWHDWQKIKAGELTEVSRVAFANLAKECVLVFHYQACHRETIPPVPLHHVRLMCIALIACPNLRVALEIASSFQCLTLRNRGLLETRVVGEQAILVLDNEIKKKSVGDLLVMMFGLASYSRLCSWLIQEEISLQRVTLKFPELDGHAEFDELFRLKPCFDQPLNSFHFSKHYLDRPITRKFEELDKLFALFPFDLLPPDYDQQTLADGVRSATIKALECNEALPSMNRLAEMFGLSTSTFRRRMNEEQASLADIRNEVRLSHANALLSQTDLTIKEVAYRTQFSDDTAFRRAFRTWTGQSPQEYRERRLPVKSQSQ